MEARVFEIGLGFAQHRGVGERSHHHAEKRRRGTCGEKRRESLLAQRVGHYIGLRLPHGRDLQIHAARPRSYDGDGRAP